MLRASCRRLHGQLFRVHEVLELERISGVADETHRPVELRARLGAQAARDSPARDSFCASPRSQVARCSSAPTFDGRLQNGQPAVRRRGRGRRRGLLDRASSARCPRADVPAPWRGRWRLGLGPAARLVRQCHGNRHARGRRRNVSIATGGGVRACTLPHAAQPAGNDNQDNQRGAPNHVTSHYDVECTCRRGRDFIAKTEQASGAAARAGRVRLSKQQRGTSCRGPASTALRSRRRAAAPCDRRATGRCRCRVPSS